MAVYRRQAAEEVSHPLGVLGLLCKYRKDGSHVVPQAGVHG